MLHFEGDKDFPKPPAEVGAKLSDARFLVECVPEGEPVGTPEPATATARLRPKIAFVRGTLEVTLRVVEAVPASSVRLAIHSKSIGASADVEAALSLTPQGGGTRVHWAADVVNLGGLLKLVPQGLIRGAAQNVINNLWAQVEAKLGV